MGTIRCCIAVLAGTVLAGAAPATAGALPRPVGDTRVFAHVPDPGQPGGIFVVGNRVYVTTLGVAHDAMSEPRLFVFRRQGGELHASHAVPADMPVMAMALYGVAKDRHGFLYVVDMNGRILRFDPRTGGQSIYARFPARAGGATTMPFDLVFDGAGNAYVTDQNLAAIWRVPPGGGEPELFFQDPRLAGYLAGPSGITLNPARSHLYFTVATSLYLGTARQGLVFRVPLVEPEGADLELVASYPAGSSPFDLLFGRSGNLYVTLNGSHQISIIRPDGTEHMRFPSPEENASREIPFDRPMGLAFDGRGSLLVTNTSFLTDEEEHMVVFDVFVADQAARLPTPSLRDQVTRPGRSAGSRCPRWSACPRRGAPGEA